MKFRDQIITHTQIYMETRKGKITVQERIHYNSERITMMVA